MNYLSEKYDWKRFEKNNLTITLNLCLLKQQKYILSMCQNKKREKQVIFLIIPDRKRWH